MNQADPTTRTQIADRIARTRKLARNASRRRFARDLLSVTGPAMTIALAGSLVGILTDRLIGPGIDWWLIAGPAAGIALVASLAIALRRRTGDLEGASEVDRSMLLEDRLSSALALAERDPENPFVQMAIDRRSRSGSGVRGSRGRSSPRRRSRSA